MQYIVGSLLSFLLLYKYVALFAITFIGASLVPLPFGTILLASGAFASQGYMNIWIVLLVAIVANILGDILGYVLARKYGVAILKVFKIGISSPMAHLENRLRKNAPVTIVITRFSSVLNAAGNLISGFIQIPFSVFFFSDVVGNILSNGPVIYGGYLAGSYWQEFSGLLDTAGGIIFVLVLAALIVIYLVQKKQPTL